MSNLIHHSYHLVDESPWPLMASLGALLITTGLLKWFHLYSPRLLAIGLSVTLLVIAQWWNDVAKEGTLIGQHSIFVELGLRYGIILFIVSEILFFSSFFWAFFHNSLAPAPEIGSTWPPLRISPFNPTEVPLLNTLVLLRSGISVTWAHHALIVNNHSKAYLGLLVTIILGFYFTCLQALEYYEASFSLADRIYGSTFFITTGFHGLHVIIGSLFLLVCLLRMKKAHFRISHHFGLEAAAWYWHFVDVVWLFLYVVIYWWGGL